MRPRAGQRPPPPLHHALFTLYLAATDTSFRKEPGMEGEVGAGTPGEREGAP